MLSLWTQLPSPSHTSKLHTNNPAETGARNRGKYLRYMHIISCLVFYFTSFFSLLLFLLVLKSFLSLIIIIFLDVFLACDTHCLQRAFHESNGFYFFIIFLKACVCPLIGSKYFKSTWSMLPYFNLVPDTKKSPSKSKNWCLVIIANYLINFFLS